MNVFHKNLATRFLEEYLIVTLLIVMNNEYCVFNLVFGSLNFYLLSKKLFHYLKQLQVIRM